MPGAIYVYIRSSSVFMAWCLSAGQLIIIIIRFIFLFHTYIRWYLMKDLWCINSVTRIISVSEGTHKFYQFSSLRSSYFYLYAMEWRYMLKNLFRKYYLTLVIAGKWDVSYSFQPVISGKWPFVIQHKSSGLDCQTVYFCVGAINSIHATSISLHHCLRVCFQAPYATNAVGIKPSASHFVHSGLYFKRLWLDLTLWHKPPYRVWNCIFCCTIGLCPLLLLVDKLLPR